MKITKFQTILIIVILARILLYDIHNLVFKLTENELLKDYIYYYCNELVICSTITFGVTFLYKKFKNLFRALLTVLGVEILYVTKTAIYVIDYESLNTGMVITGFALVIVFLINSIKTKELIWK